MPGNEAEEFEFRLRMEREAGTAAPAKTGMAGLEAIEPTYKPPVDTPLAPGLAPSLHQSRDATFSTPNAIGDAAGKLWRDSKLEGLNPIDQIGGQLPHNLGRLAEGVPTAARKIAAPLGQAWDATAGRVPELMGAGAKGARAEATAASRAAALQGVEGQSVKTEGEIAAAYTDFERAQAKAGKAVGKAEQDVSRVDAAASRAEAAARRQDRNSARWDAIRGRLQQGLDAERATPVADLHAQGTRIHETYSTARQVAEAEREAVTKPLYKAAVEKTNAQHAQGLRVDTKGAEAAIDRVVKLLDGHTDTQRQLKGLKSAITGVVEREAAVAPGGPPPHVDVGSLMGMPSPGAAAKAAPGKTVEQLIATKQKLYEIAYSGEMQGYDAHMRRAAQDAARAIEKSLTQFSPDYAAANDAYRKLSEPLNTLNTRMGKLLTGTEGGLKGDIYDKVPKAELPKRIFSSRENIEHFTEMLAGGADASPAAKAAAGKQVDQMALDYILKTSPENPAKAGSRIIAPQMEAALGGLPGVKDALGAKFSDLGARTAKLERATAGAKDSSRQAEQLGAKAETLRGRQETLGVRAADKRDAATEGLAATNSKLGASAAEKRARVEASRTALRDADQMAGHTDTKSKRDALNQYERLMEANRASIPDDKYNAIVALNSRAHTLDARLALMKKVATWAAGGMVAEAGYKLLN